MSETTRPDAAVESVANETGGANTDTAETVESAPEAQLDGVTDESADNADTFDRAYVEKLRKESAGYRDKAKTADANADALSQRLHAALVTATGRLADPADLPYAAEHLESPEALNAAIDSLLEAKPHFKSRVPRGDVGQGVKDSAPAQFDLGARLRSLV